MWIEERQTQKGTVYRYYERYRCPKTNTMKRVSVTLNGNSPKHQKRAYTMLMCKINEIKEVAIAAPPIITLYQAVNEWEEHIKPTLSERTQETHKTTINKIYTLFEDIPITDLKSVYIEEILIKFHHIDKASYRYTSKILAILKNTLQYARRKGYINDIQDFLELKIKPRPKTLKEVEKSNNKFLDHDELKECFTQLATMNKRIGLLVEFMTFTGLRIGELLALRECDYDRFNGVININGSIMANIRKRGTPKNIYSYRDVPLNSRAKEIIEFFIRSNRWLYMSLGEPQKEDRYIFINQNGIPYEAQFINKVLKRLDVNGKHISTHVFRHTHISLLSELGIPLKAIMARVGHNDPRTTLAIYSHVTENMKSHVVEKLDTITI